jgi:hypothetical protein
MGGDYDSIGKAADALFDIFLWLWENVEIGLK